jgi:hypothetical protein
MLAATWGEGIFRLLLLIAGWGTGIVLFLYGVALFIQHGLMAADVIDIPSAIGSITAVRWHLLVWDPYWFLGGVLFIRAAKAFRRAWK